MRKRILWLAGLILLSCTGSVLAAGLTANIAEVIIENLRIGYSFSARNKANLPLVITNVGPGEIEVKVEALAPAPEQVKKGYEPIPDAGWIKLEKNFFILKPNEQASTDLVFNIPNDEKLMGKKFAAIIYSYTYEGMLKIGVNSQILFTIDTEKGPYPTVLGATEFKEKVTFELDPIQTTVKDVPLGKKVNLRKAAKSVFKITNPTDQECSFYMNTIPLKGFHAELQEGYEETPDPKFLSFSEEVIRIKPKETKEVKLYLNFPQDKKYAGKNYMFLIAVVLGEQQVPMIRYSYLYVTTKP